jgi:hypothetical protein
MKHFTAVIRLLQTWCIIRWHESLVMSRLEFITGLYSKVRLLALPSNIRLGWTCLTVTSTASLTWCKKLYTEGPNLGLCYELKMCKVLPIVYTAIKSLSMARNTNANGRLSTIHLQVLTRLDDIFCVKYILNFFPKGDRDCRKYK